MALVHGSTIFKQLTANHTRGGDDTILLAKSSSHSLNSFFTAHREVIHLNVLQFVLIKGVLFNYEGKHILVLEGFQSFGNLLFGFVLFFGQHLVVDAHHVQETGGHLALLHVLRLVVHTRATTPTHEQQHRDVVHLLVDQRSQRVDDVALATVLHIHAGGLASGQIVTGCQTYGSTLVGSNNVVCRIKMVGDVGTHILQQRIRDTGKAVNTVLS